jgi:restriction endonuclease XhoI-like protein
LEDLDGKLKTAVQKFWETRDHQGNKQKSSGKADSGFRSAVTGGKQLEGFEEIGIDIALKAGIDRKSIFQSRAVELPGYFRPTKKWDLLIVDKGNLVAAIEFKSQVGPSFGNNFNNRLEEAVGSATDLWTGYREGAFKDSPKPWLGYFFLLEDCEKSRQPVKVKEPHFKVFPEFKEASYINRYEIMLQKFLRERLYDGCSLILSKRKPISFSQANKDLTVKRFFIHFQSQLQAYIDERKS